jgi:hypothetical protein
MCLGVPAAARLICGLALSTGPASAATNLLTNPGFETGNLSGWTCSATDRVTTSPVHSGSYALGARPAAPTTLTVLPSACQPAGRHRTAHAAARRGQLAACE